MEEQRLKYSRNLFFKSQYVSFTYDKKGFSVSVIQIFYYVSHHILKILHSAIKLFVVVKCASRMEYTRIISMVGVKDV